MSRGRHHRATNVFRPAQVQRPGMTLLELIFAIGLFMLFVAGAAYLLMGDFTPFVGSRNSRMMKRFANEAVEVLKSIKDRSWKHIADNATGENLKISKDAQGDWILSPGTDTRAVFTRAIVLTAVSRDGNGEIAASGADDPAVKKATVTVSADGRSDFVLETYLFSWEAFRMTQTDWRGDAGVVVWGLGQDDYDSQTDMDLPTTTDHLGVGEN